MTTSVGEDFPHELARVRELRQAYADLGRPGLFGLGMIDGVIKLAEEAQASGDVVAIVRAYAALKGCE